MADSDVLIRCENVSKKFCKDLKKSLWYGLKGLAAEAVGRDRHHETLRNGEFWAVKDISFEVKRGECLGLLGHNGAGKTTLLKMLNGLIRPDHGRIEMRGQIGAMIALGAGFNPILTGKENIYIAGSLRGLTKRQIDAKLDDIIGFSEMKEFINMPVQSYSSGMQVRLGFATAINMDPDILLIDEVLAVGDIAFRLKCYNEIYRIVKNAAVIFVSHSMPQIARLCSRGLVMNHGKEVLLTNSVPDAIHRYNEMIQFQGTTTMGDGRARARSLTVTSDTGASASKVFGEDETGSLSLAHRESITLDLELEVDRSVSAFRVSYNFLDVEQKIVAQCEVGDQLSNSGAPIRFKTRIDRIPLNRGRFSLGLMVLECASHAEPMLAGYRDVVTLDVTLERVLGASPIQLTAETEISRSTGVVR